MWWQAQKREAAGIGDGASKLKLTHKSNKMLVARSLLICHNVVIIQIMNSTTMLPFIWHIILIIFGKGTTNANVWLKQPQQFHFSSFGSLSISTVCVCCPGWGYLCCSLVRDTQSTAKGHRNHWWLTIVPFDLFRFPALPYQAVIPSVIHQKDTIETIRACQGHF